MAYGYGYGGAPDVMGPLMRMLPHIERLETQAAIDRALAGAPQGPGGVMDYAGAAQSARDQGGMFGGRAAEHLSGLGQQQAEHLSKLGLDAARTSLAERQEAVARLEEAKGIYEELEGAAAGGASVDEIRQRLVEGGFPQRAQRFDEGDLRALKMKFWSRDANRMKAVLEGGERSREAMIAAVKDPETDDDDVRLMTLAAQRYQLFDPAGLGLVHELIGQGELDDEKRSDILRVLGDVPEVAEPLTTRERFDKAAAEGDRSGMAQAAADERMWNERTAVPATRLDDDPNVTAISDAFKDASPEVKRAVLGGMSDTERTSTLGKWARADVDVNAIFDQPPGLQFGADGSSDMLERLIKADEDASRTSEKARVRQSVLDSLFLMQPRQREQAKTRWNLTDDEVAQALANGAGVAGAGPAAPGTGLMTGGVPPAGMPAVAGPPGVQAPGAPAGAPSPAGAAPMSPPSPFSRFGGPGGGGAPAVGSPPGWPTPPPLQVSEAPPIDARQKFHTPPQGRGERRASDDVAALAGR